ncbi:MAG: hypothetical protein ABIZ80_14355, partial [Bryobacteraceae bacterium]
HPQLIPLSRLHSQGSPVCLIDAVALTLTVDQEMQGAELCLAKRLFGLGVSSLSSLLPSYVRRLKKQVSRG